MRYAKDLQDKLVDVQTIKTVEGRRDILYYCPECEQPVSYIWSEEGKITFDTDHGTSGVFCPQ